MASGSQAPIDDRSNDPEGLDRAIEYAIEQLEGEEPLDRDEIIATFPQYAAELNQFLDNWLAIEHRTAQAIPASIIGSPIGVDSCRGKRVGEHELLEEISIGGMGIVYKAKHLSLGRIVALKMIMNTRRDAERFRIEAEAGAALYHSNIVSIYEVGQHEGHPFISMQYIEGGNLKDRLKQGCLAPREAAKLVETLALAVHYAHQRGILHRDLKPANVLLDVHGKPYLTDFGLAKQMGNSAELTRSGAILGTPGYMSPEQAMGQVKSITVAADVYGLGAILYAALTGEPPFQGESDLKTLRRVIEEPAPNIRSRRPEIDRNLATICHKCLEKTPTARYASAKHLADDLGRFLRDEPVVARPIGFFERRWRWCRRNPAIAVLSAAACVSLVVASALTARLQWNRYQTDIDTRFARIREEALEEAIAALRTEAKNSGSVAIQKVADLYTLNGLQATQSDRAADALLWFVHAMQLKGIDASQAMALERRCHSWLDDSPKPIAAHKLIRPFSLETLHRDMRSFHQRPGKSELMLKSGDDLVVWNYKNDELWRPSPHGPVVSFGRWSRDGKTLILGHTTGEVRILDADTKQHLQSIECDQPVHFIAPDHDDRWMAIAYGNHVQSFDGKTGEASGPRWDHADDVHYVDFSPDNRRIVTTAADSKTRLFSTEAGDALPLVELNSFSVQENTLSQAFMPVFSEDSQSLFYRASPTVVRAIDTTTHQPCFDPMVAGTNFSIARSFDGHYWVCGGPSYGRLQTFIGTEKGSFIRHHDRLTHDSPISTVGFSRNRWVATGGLDRMVRIWSVGLAKPADVELNENQVPLAVIPHQASLVRVVFSDNDRNLVTVQTDGLIRVWRLPSFLPRGYRMDVPSVGATVRVDEEHWLESGATHWLGKNTHARLRRLRDGQVVGESLVAKSAERGLLMDAQLTPDKQTLVALYAARGRSRYSMYPTDGRIAGRIEIQRFPDSEPLGPPLYCDSEPRSLAFHSNGREAAVLTARLEVLLVDTIQGTMVGRFHPSEHARSREGEPEPKPESVFNGSVRFSHDSTRLYAWGAGTGFSAWDVDSRQPLFSTEFAKDWNIVDMEFATLSNKIAIVAKGRSEVVIIDGLTGERLRVIEHPSNVTSAAMDAHGKYLLTGSDDGFARLFQLDSGERVIADIFHRKQIHDVILLDGMQHFGTLSADHQVRIWNVRDGQLALKALSVPFGSKNLCASPDSRYLIAFGITRELGVLDLELLHEHRPVAIESTSRLAELVAGKQIRDHQPFPLTTAEWLHRWNKPSASGDLSR